MMELRTRAVGLRGPSLLPGLLPAGMIRGVPVDGTSHVLTNSQATFTFLEDNFSGLRLDTLTRAGGTHTWKNREQSLWNLSTLDVTARRPYPEKHGSLAPIADHLAPVTSDGTNLVATWNTTVGGEALSVTMTFTLVEDWIRVKISAAWVGTPSQYAIEAIQCMPLKIEPIDPAADLDVACCAAVKGVMVVSPIYKFRMVPHDTAQPSGYYLGYGRNFGNYPSGRTLSMPLWGYYGLLAPNEGWMVWYEDHTEEQQHVYFDSDGHHMCWESWRGQEDMLFAGNDAGTTPATLEVTGTYCLRPFGGVNIHTWWNIADHYRARLDATAPYFRPPQPRNNPTLNSPLRGGYLHFHSWTRTSTTEQEIIDIAANIRTNVGLKPDNEFLGLGLADNTIERPWAPLAPTINGKGRWRQIVKVVRDHHVYMGHQKPSFCLMPQVYSNINWDDTTDQFVDKELVRVMVTSRKGFLEGDTDLLRTEENTGFYFETRTYTIKSFDTATGLLTINETFDRAGQWKGGTNFGGSRVMWRQGGASPLGEWAGGTVDIYPKSGEMRPVPDPLTQVYIIDLVWYTGSGGTLIPVGGEEMLFASRQEVVYCPHALDHAEAWIQWLTRNYWAAGRTAHGESVFYYDVFPVFRQRLPRAQACNADHTGWNQLDAGYVAHPKGWGPWWHRSLRSFMGKVIDLTKARLSDKRALWMAEYVDEQYLDLVPGCLHNFGLTSLFRTTSKTNDDPDDHGIRAIPWFSIVHGGRGFGLSWGQEMGDILISVAGRNDNFYDNAGDAHKFRLAIAYAMAVEWPFGFQPLTYLHIAPGNPDQGTDLWDPAEYLPGHPLGAADPEVALIRDLFTDLCQAEIRWAHRWLRNGRLLPFLVAVAPSNFVSIEDSVFGQVDVTGLGTLDASTRLDAGLIWSPSSFAAVTHGVWRHYVDNSVCVFFTTPFDVAGLFRATITFSEMGMLDEPHEVYRVSPLGTLTFLTTVVTSYLIDLVLAPFAFDALLFLPISEIDTTEYQVHIVIGEDQEIPVTIPPAEIEVSVAVVNAQTIQVHIPGGLSATGEEVPGGPGIEL